MNLNLCYLKLFIIYEFKMYRLASSLMAQKLIWIIQYWYAGQVKYYRINDSFEMQQIINNVLKVYMYGYIKDISHKLDLVAES